MNHQERGALGVILDQLWADDPLTPRQRELLTAAKRIVAGNTNGNELPNPWPPGQWHETARPIYDPQPGWSDRLLNFLARKK